MDPLLGLQLQRRDAATSGGQLMAFFQIRINYNTDGHSQPLYRELLGPLYEHWAQCYFYRWSIAKSWRNGRHVVLTLDGNDPFFRPEMPLQAQLRIESFLRERPSSGYDLQKYLQMQTTLAGLEGADVDASWLADNNTCEVRSVERTELAARYESPEQWESVFDAEASLLPVLLRQWLHGTDNERFACELLILLACVYPPQPSAEAGELNGFLSYHSHYLLWRHRLPAGQATAVDRKFAADFADDRDRLLSWLTGLAGALEYGHAGVKQLAVLLTDAFLRFTRLAVNGAIHARSPYPKQQLAPADTVTDFHLRYFYNADGTANQFNEFFCGYRWLMNIVYRVLPLFDVSPLKRHYFNFVLDKLQAEQPQVIRLLRSQMLAAR
jgi:hypothetical protein